MLDIFNNYRFGFLYSNNFFCYTIKSRLYKLVINIYKLFVLIFFTFGCIELILYVWDYIILYREDILSIFYSRNIKLFYFWISLLFFIHFLYLHRIEDLTINKKIQSQLTDVYINYNNIVDNKQVHVKNIEISSYYTKELKKIIEYLYIKNITNIKGLFNILKNTNSFNFFINRLEINKQIFLSTIENNGDTTINIQYIVLKSFIDAIKNNYKKVNTNIFIITLISNIDFLNKYVEDVEKINKSDINEYLQFAFNTENKFEDISKIKKLAIFKWIDTSDKAMKSKPAPFLNKISTDLTKKAKDNLCDITIGYEDKINLLIEYIKTSELPVLIVGNSGIGKTALIEHLALLMASEEIDFYFQDKRLLLLNLGELVSGDDVNVNEIAKRASNLCKEIIGSGNIIFVIENISLIAGDLSGGGNFNILNIFLSYIGQKNFKFISTISYDDYIRQLKKNATAFNKFNVIELKELKPNLILGILKYKAFLLEEKYKVLFSIKSLHKIHELSKRYLSNKLSPGKDINIMINVIQFIKQNNFNNIITTKAITDYLSKKFNTNISEINLQEKEDLKNLETNIRKNIIGQEEAVIAVANALKRARLDLRDVNKPIASFLFCGPTGVGKTELSKVITSIYFNDVKKMIRLDMSEFHEKKSIDRLIGNEEKDIYGVLTEKVLQNPFSLILLDEIEKAHQDIFNLFLQILDEGYCHDGYGKFVDFRNCIIICTSNAGAIDLQNMLKNNVSIDIIKEKFKDEILLRYFAPEFLNRFTKIVIFKPLTFDEAINIAEILFKKESEILSKKSIYLSWTNDALKLFTKKYFDIKYGARPMKHGIINEVSDKIADMLLQGKIKKGDKILYTGNEIILLH